MVGKAVFDEWPERYEEWFATPIGELVRKAEGKLISSLLAVKPGEKILDAGCGTGVFTDDFLSAGALVTGVDISWPMLWSAREKLGRDAFFPVQADMRQLPFRDNSFDKSVSITALEFIADAGCAIDELFRVTRPGGLVVAATLNSLSPWAERRRSKTERHILEGAIFRSRDELLALSPLEGAARTAVHFNKNDDPAEAALTEQKGESLGLETGAFVAVRWQKPGV